MMNEFYIAECDRDEFAAILLNGGGQPRVLNCTSAGGLKSIGGSFGFIRVNVNRDDIQALVEAGLAETLQGGYSGYGWRLTVSAEGMSRLHREGRLSDNRVGK